MSIIIHEFPSLLITNDYFYGFTFTAGLHLKQINSRVHSKRTAMDSGKQAVFNDKLSGSVVKIKVAVCSGVVSRYQFVAVCYVGIQKFEVVVVQINLSGIND